MMENQPPSVVRRIVPVPSAATKAPPTRQGTISTRIVLISDTHNVPLYCNDDKIHAFRKPLPAADVLIHAGDLTNYGTEHQHKVTFKVLAEAKAELKLVIAGNHDISLHRQYYTRWPIGSEDEQAEQLKGKNGLCDRVRDLWTDDNAKEHRIQFLDEGMHTFKLSNGAQLKVYASPWTPEFCDWAFNYPRDVDRWNPKSDGTFPPNPIPNFPEVDIAITHGPPASVLDLTSEGANVGCEALWNAIRRARPRLHVFGHIHEGWGAEVADWTRGKVTKVEIPDRDEILKCGWAGADATRAQIGSDKESSEQVTEGDREEPRFGEQTLFVNAAIMNAAFKPDNAPWVTNILLPKASTA